MSEESWLSLTPEPERELPAVVAALRAGREPRPDEVERERTRVAAIVVGGGEGEWLAYLSEAAGLMLGPPGGTPLSEADRAAALEVLANHHRLLLGLPGDAAERTTAERADLERALDLPPSNDTSRNGGP